MIRLLLFAIAFIPQIIFSPILHGQVTLDGSMGQAGTLPGPDYEISAEMGRQAGANLFHSFGKFSVETGGSATFSGPDSVGNIIGRVTDGAVSSIDGILRSTVPGANLYLLNPAGMVFGPNAGLDLTGSFYASTADHLKLGEIDRFYAEPVQGEFLSTAPPADFGFLGEGSASASALVRVDGELSVPTGEKIGIEAGRIEIRGGLQAGEGEVKLSAGERIDLVGGRIDVSGEGAGSIYIRGGELVVDGGALWAETEGDTDGGKVDIKARSADFTNGGSIYAESYGNGDAASVSIQASEGIFFSGSDSFGGTAGIRTGASGEEYEEAGDAGDIHIEADRIHLDDGAVLEAASFGGGRGGDITLKALSVVGLSGTSERGSGSRINTSAETDYAKDAGAIQIEAEALEMTDGALIDTSTFGPGRGGDITIRANSLVSLSGFDGSGQGSGMIARADGPDEDAGDGGDILIETGDLTLTDGGWIGNTSDGPGSGGNVTIGGAGAVRFSGTDANGYAGRIYTSALGEDEDAGDAGNIEINAGSISFTDGGGVTASTGGPGRGGSVTLTAGDSILISGENPDAPSGEMRSSGLSSSSLGEDYDSGDSGEIRLEAPDITVAEGGVITSATWGGGDAGSIRLKGLRIAIAGGGSSVLASTEGWDADAGDAGIIHLEGDQLELTDGAQIGSSSYGGGRGGDVTVETASSVRFSGTDEYGQGSGIYTRAEGEEYDEAGDAGNIAIQTRNFALGDGSVIESASYGGGGGGAVTITAPGWTRLSGNDGDGLGSRILVSAETSYSRDAGNVAIETGDLSLADGALIDSSTFGTGRGGDVSIRAADSVRFTGYDEDGQGSGIIARADGSDEDAGRGGDVAIQTGTLIFADGGWIGNTSDGGGRGGDVRISARSVDFSGTDRDGFASRIYTSALSTEEYAKEAGNIEIQAQSLRFSGGAGVTAGTRGTGDGGLIKITADEMVLTGGNPHGQNRDGFSSGIFARSEGEGESAGKGGSIQLETRDLTLSDGGRITSSTLGPGKSGSIEVRASENIRISGSSTPSAPPLESQQEFEEGNPEAPDTFISGIYSSSEKKEAPAGDAGEIRISAGNLTLMENGQISTSAEKAGGGAMEIAVDDRLYLLDGRITTSVQYGEGNGGDIIIQKPEFVILNRSRIIARAWEGTGGNIRISSDYFLSSPDSAVDASSHLGIDGMVNIESPEVDMTGSLTVLPANFLDAAKWLTDPCTARTGEGDISRFIVQGREIAPLPFSGILSNPIPCPDAEKEGCLR